MAYYEDLLAKSQIKTFSRKYDKIDVVKDQIGVLMPVKTLDDVNMVLKLCSLPTISDTDKCLPDIHKLLKELKERCIYPTFEPMLEECLERESKIELIKKCEYECDLLEITLANSKSKLEELKELENTDINELHRQYKSLNEGKDDFDFEKKNESVLLNVYSFIKGECVDRHTLNAFYYLKEDKKYANIMEKSAILESIYEGTPTNERALIQILLDKGLISLIDLEKIFKLDRIEVLKMVYGLVAKDIATFDKESNVIRINL